MSPYTERQRAIRAAIRAENAEAIAFENLLRASGARPLKTENPMPRIAFDNESMVALECLKLALTWSGTPENAVKSAHLFYDFVAGTDRAALVEEAKAAIDKAVG